MLRVSISSCRFIKIIDARSDLQLKKVPKRMLVMGGGIIGLEMGTVYH
ncbi:MAG TPA: FAD-dependent oxidoreductase, partial [Arsenophonus nasoniae]